MGKEIYLDPIEFQNVLEKFEKGSSEVKSRLLCKMLYNVFTISTYQN
ncbi:hypothetical protein [Staphylococcus aureus]|nr:hypothetical protein [Staphylococcus aureus]